MLILNIYRWIKILFQCLPPSLTHFHAHTSHRDYIHMLESYISIEDDFFPFISHIRAEYDPSAISKKGTLKVALQEVCMSGHSNPAFKLTAPHLLSSGPEFCGCAQQILHKA